MPLRFFSISKISAIAPRGESGASSVEAGSRGIVIIVGLSEYSQSKIVINNISNYYYIKDWIWQNKAKIANYFNRPPAPAPRNSLSDSRHSLSFVAIHTTPVGGQSRG